MSGLNLALFHWMVGGEDASSWMLLAGRLLAHWGGYLSALLVLWAAWRFEPDRRQVALVIVGAGVAAVLSHVLAAFLGFQRPFVLGLTPAYISHSSSASLPSTHATVMFFVAIQFALHAWLWRLSIMLFALACLTGWARVYVGVHFPLDITAGFLLAVALAASFYLFERLNRLLAPVQIAPMDSLSRDFETEEGGKRRAHGF